MMHFTPPWHCCGTASVLKQEVVLQFAAGLSGWWFTEVPYNHTPCYGLNQNSLANFLLCAGQFGVWLHCLYFPFWANTKRLFVSKRSVPTQWSCGALRLWLHSKLEHAQYCDNPCNEGFPLHIGVDLFSVGVHKQEQTVKTSDNVIEFKCVSEHYAARLGNVSMTVPATRFLSGPFCCCTFCAVGQAAHLIEELQYGTFHSLSHIFHPHVILTQIIYHRDSNKTLSFTTSHRLTDIMSSFPVQPQ